VGNGANRPACRPARRTFKEARDAGHPLDHLAQGGSGQRWPSGFRRASGSALKIQGHRIPSQHYTVANHCMVATREERAGVADVRRKNRMGRCC
jgi:hypothetical protein